MFSIYTLYFGFVVEKKRHSRMKKMGKAEDAVETFETLVSDNKVPQASLPVIMKSKYLLNYGLSLVL